MNPNNYCTLPIAKRLHEAGILNREPEIGDRVSINDSSFGEGFIVAIDKHGAMPAYRVELDTGGGYWGDSDQLVILHSLAEVWQELPDGVCLNKSDLCGNYISVLLLDQFGNAYTQDFENDNPTDAACLLLLWVKGEGR